MIASQRKRWAKSPTASSYFLLSHTMSRSFSLLMAAAITLGSPLSALAASATGDSGSTDSITSEDILDVVLPADSMSAPVMDGKGGGAMGSIYYPGPGYGGVQVSADVTKSVTPDFVAINAYCDSGKQPSRQAARDMLNQLFTDIKNMVGKDGRVRKSGSVTPYPYYEPSGAASDSFTASLSVFIRITNKTRTQAINDFLEDRNCSANWDVRLISTQEHELSILDDLAKQLNARKTVFEKLLGKKLKNISSASLSTWVDGYSSYDPETNTADATSTLSVTFDLGGRASITPSPATRTAPRG